MRRTYRTLNDYEMQHNAEVGLFTESSILSNKEYNHTSILSPHRRYAIGFEQIVLGQNCHLFF